MTWYVAADRRRRRRATGRIRCVQTQLGVEPRARRHGVRCGALSGDGGAAHRAAGRMSGRAARAAPPVHPRPRLADAGGRGGRAGLRWWCITTLGPQWNTRVIVIPGAPRVTGGPYRLIPHPNYVAVVVEGIALPLVHTAWITAVVFTVLNAVLLEPGSRWRTTRWRA